MHRGVLLAAATILAAIGLPGPGFAQPTDAPTEVADDPVASAYAANYSVTVAEAKRRLALLSQIQSIDARLRQAIPNAYAGLYVEHTPVFRVVVKTTGDARAALSAVTTDPLFQPENAAVSLGNLESAKAQVVRLLSAIGIQFESLVDVRNERIDTNVIDLAKAQQAIAALIAAHPQLKLNQVAALPKNTAAIIGGREALGSTQVCTSGLTVKKGTQEGVLTAGHCDSTVTVSGSSLALIARSLTSSTTNGYDAQWNGKTSNTYPNQILTSSSAVMNVNSTYNPRTLPIGWSVCKYGNSTGNTCGTIKSTGTVVKDNLGYTGSHIVVAPTGSSPMNLEGDSGGPVYGSGTAYGLVKGRGSSSNPNDMYFTSILDIAPLGVTVKTVP